MALKLAYEPMTSNTTPYPQVASASSVYGNDPGNAAWRSFDLSNEGGVVDNWNSGGGIPQWLQIDLGVSKNISKVTIEKDSGNAGNSTTIPILSWQIQYSNDGINFIILLTETDYVWGGVKSQWTKTFNPVSARYWRLYVTNTTGTYVRPGLFLLYEEETKSFIKNDGKYYEISPAVFTSGGLAYELMTSNSTPAPQIAYASSVYGADFQAWKSFDGDNVWNDNWYSAGRPPVWLAIDFGHEKMIERVAIEVDGAGNWLTQPRSFRVEYSNDNMDWTAVASADNYVWSKVHGELWEQEIAPVSARYWRVFITENYGQSYTSLGLFLLYTPKVLVRPIGLVEVDPTNADGISDVSLINKDLISTLSGDVYLVQCDPDGNELAEELAVTAKVLTGDNMIRATGDIDLANVANISNITVGHSTTGNGFMKMAVSVDSGATWLVFNNGAFTPLASLDADLRNLGMSPAELQTITQTEWLSLAPTKLRFAYGLYQDAIGDNVELRNITLDLEYKGVFKESTDALYAKGDDFIEIRFNAAGTYNVNYHTPEV